MSEDGEKAVSWIEKNFQNMIMAGLGALCSWMAVTTQALTVQVAEMNTKIGYMQDQIKTGSDDRYHAADANRDLALRDSQINDLRRRVATLEGFHGSGQRIDR